MFQPVLLDLGSILMELVVIACLVGLIPAMIAASKGRNAVGWWVYGTLLFIVALPHSIIASDIRFKCPLCRERIQEGASICPHCRSRLYWDGGEVSDQPFAGADTDPGENIGAEDRAEFIRRHQPLE